MPPRPSASPNFHGAVAPSAVDFATVKRILAGHRALVLEDDSESFGRLFLSLSSAGCPAVLARRWAEMERLVRRVSPTLIVFSASLKELSGTEIVHRLRQETATRAAILVARADRDSKRERRRLLALGCDGYVGKPTDRYLFATDLVVATPRLIAGAGDAAAPRG